MTGRPDERLLGEALHPELRAMAEEVEVGGVPPGRVRSGGPVIRHVRPRWACPPWWHRDPSAFLPHLLFIV